MTSGEVVNCAPVHYYVGRFVTLDDPRTTLIYHLAVYGNGVICPTGG